MITLTADWADNLYWLALDSVMKRGELTYPRGFVCKELSPCHLSLLNPRSNIISNPLRKMNKAFAAAELVWILEGRNDVEFLEPYNSKIKYYSDDGITYFGAYGPKYISQINYVLSTLSKDPWSRQAIINIWRENPPESKDIPCTIALHFIIRPLNKLNLIVYMRSQDCWLGLPYDLHNFTCIQIIVASMLKIEVGTFELIQGSLHAYSHDFNRISNLLNFMPPAETDAEITPIKPLNILQQKHKWMEEYVARKV